MNLRTPTTAAELEAGISKIHELVAARQESLNSLARGIKTPGIQQESLDRFLQIIELAPNDETRYAAFMRLANLKPDGIVNYFTAQKKSLAQIDALLERAYLPAAEHHTGLHKDLIEQIESEGLLSPFYLAVLKWAHSVGEGFNAFQIAWQRHLIAGINRELDAKFDNDQAAIMDYLKSQDLFDKGYNGEEADCSFSVLVETEHGYVKRAYTDAFPAEIGMIRARLEEFIASLEVLEDPIYDQKEAYIHYLTAIHTAFGETNTDALVEKWALVDTAWMSVTAPIQITHPLEHYEDVYRKAVGPEWDLRIVNPNLFESRVKTNMVSMFEKLAAQKWLSPADSVYSYSLANLHRAQLYISSPVLYYGSHLNGLMSAQVVPNDPIVSKEYGKKIYSFPEHVLRRMRSTPQPKIRALTLDPSLIEHRNALLQNPDPSVFYKLYDIETIGHEFGHALWTDMQTEVRMNVYGNYKNIEEWKATTGGLVAFFMNPEEEMKLAVIVDLIVRAVTLIEWMKVEDVVPYYTEGLIHLHILFESGMISLDADKKVTFHYSPETYESLVQGYLTHYNALIDSYLAEEDATIFLERYTTHEGKYFYPKNPEIRGFVEYYTELYERIGNEIEES